MRLKEYRLKRGISVQELAFQLREQGYNVSMPTLIRWESGKEPSIKGLMALAQVYGVDIKELLEIY